MIDNNHSAFFPPKDNCTLWRYVDLTKLLSLLENRTLHFTRADEFDDPYEGMPSPAVIRLMRNPDSNGGFPVERLGSLVEGIEGFGIGSV
jgi:hypothetical protein